MNKSKFIAELGKLNPSSTFLTLHRYTNEAGEIADYNLVFHISYKNALQKSLETLAGLDPKSDLERQAKDELMESFNNSIIKMEETAIEDLEDGYIRFFNEQGSYIKGIKLHEASDTLHLYGFVVNKRIIEPGIYKKTNKRPLTIVKDNLRKLCKVSKFRQFKIKADQLEKITVHNMDILPPK